MFYKEQNKEAINSYSDLLMITASLSNLFSESVCPFIHYRTMENIFCDVFEANNLSRSDVALDAVKGKYGIGLKTFLHENGRTFQKIAEFNKNSYTLEKMKAKEIVKKVSEMRNLRLTQSKKAFEVDILMYHLITRSKNRITIYEEYMDEIEVSKIKVTKITRTTIHFNDGLNEYNFNISKSTLLKRFVCSKMQKLESIDIEIVKEPFKFLQNCGKQDISNTLITDTKSDYAAHPDFRASEDFIILPLYSPRSGEVEKKSGLNMWNASGRERDKDEVYIPVPSIIHEIKPEFFEYRFINNVKTKNTNSFKVTLPNKQIISMKVTQSNGKALQSDPNKTLGKWILRDVLGIKDNTLVSRIDLENIGIDSVRMTRINGDYYLDFSSVGSYEEFITNYSK